MHEQLSLQIELARQLRVREAVRDLKAYLQYTRIAARPEPRPFLEVALPWQIEIAMALGQMVDAAVGLAPSYRGPRNAFLCMPRGHDKSSGIGRLLNRALRAAPRPFNGVVAAGDRDQAALLYEAMKDEARLNPWWSQDAQGLPLIAYNSNSATGPGGRFRVLASNAPTEWGGRYDLVVCDEISHWERDDMFRALWSGRHKVPGSAFIIITNAGTLGSWQHEMYLRAKGNPDSWYFFEIPPHEHWATWTDARELEEIRATLDPSEARRVLDNVWIDPAEESGYLTKEAVEQCCRLGVDLGLHYQTRGRPGVPYYVGIDYAPTSDRTALAVVHPDVEGRRIVPDRLDVIQGRPGDPVRIEVVEDWIEQVARDFGRPTFVVDPYQLEGSIQKFEGRYRVERFEPRGGKSNYEMAVCLRNLIMSQRLPIYQGMGWLPTPKGGTSFAEELKGLIVKRTPYGYRFDHEANAHDDMAVAVGMACLFAAREYPTIWLPPEPVRTPRNATPGPLFIDRGLDREEGEKQKGPLFIPGGPGKWRIFGMG